MPDEQFFAAGALRLTQADGTAQLTIHRPERRNAIDSAIWAAMPQALAALTPAHQTRLLILRGSAGHFAAGADITEFDTVFADRAAALHYGGLMGTALDALAALPCPTLAVIQGSCVGAGVALALACDLRMAEGSAQFGVTPARLGLMYSLRDTRRLMLAVGPSAALDLLYTGRLLDAAQALAIGLVNEVHLAQDFEAAVQHKAALVTAASPWSARQAKSVAGRVLQGQLDDDAVTLGWFADAVEGTDFHEGLAAFKARRRPLFPGR